VKWTKIKDILDNVLVNTMTPLGKQCQGVHCSFFSTLSADARILKVKVAHFLLVSNDPPLDLKAPKPSFANARNGSTFGFQSRASVTVSQLLKMAVPEMDD
jgi:hypothetical protein